MVFIKNVSHHTYLAWSGSVGRLKTIPRPMIGGLLLAGTGDWPTAESSEALFSRLYSSDLVWDRIQRRCILLLFRELVKELEAELLGDGRDVHRLLVLEVTAS